MGKRKPKPPVELPDGSLDDGMLKAIRPDLDSMFPNTATLEDMMEAIEARNDEVLDEKPSDIVNRIGEWLQSVASQHPSGKDAPLHATLARELLEQLHGLQTEIKTCDSSRKLRRAFNLGRIIGQKVERIDLDSRYAALVRSERGRRKGASQQARSLNEGYEELHGEYQRLVDEQLGAGLNYTAACEAVAKKMVVSPRTVQRHTQNPNPRNRRAK